ncbi:hypothetical protein [Bounagaea algeriensis]
MQDSDSTSRHNHLGGVRVTDLLRRSGRYERLARAVLSGEHGGSAQPPRPARTGIVVIGVALLCAALTVLAVILRLGTGADPPADAHAEPGTAAPVTGAPALAPEVLRSGGTSCAGHPEPGGAQRPLPVTPSNEREQVADPAAGSSTSAVRTVRSFYGALATEPAAALPWLHPQLRGGTQHDLVSAWSGTEAVRLTGVTARRDGPVLAEAAVHCSDGSRVTLRQAFAVSEEPGASRITDVRLLSARRTHPR